MARYDRANYKAVVTLAFVALTLTCFCYLQLSSRAADTGLISEQQTKQKLTKAAKSKYAKFSHSTPKHQQVCSSCHTLPASGNQSGNDAFPDVTDYPKHESCLNCHRQQFYKGKLPAICSICHTNVSPDDGTRHAFANPREKFDATPKGEKSFSEFVINFPHTKHLDLLGGNDDVNNDSRFVTISFRTKLRKTPEDSCAICHQTYQPQGKSSDEFALPRPKTLTEEAFWLKKGTFKTSPNSHVSCFTCHTQEGVLPAASNCAACHQLQPALQPPIDFDEKLAMTMGVKDKRTLEEWRKRDSSATFPHDSIGHNDLSCSACHNVSAINTLDNKTLKVSIQSCTQCHITATSDDGGVLNSEVDARKNSSNFQCVKCHISFGNGPVPESHIKAINVLKAK